MDRREFVYKSAALALGGATVAGRAAAQETPLRVAVVGTGGRGTDLIRKLATITTAEIVAVCDDYPPHLERGAEAAGPQATAYRSYTEMLRSETPQVVVIATPLYLHYEMSMEALAAGCDVFCEKTMCKSVEDSLRLDAEVRKRGAVFQVGLQRRANAIYKQAAAMVQAGMLGRITSVKCQWHRNNNWRRPVPVGRDHPSWERLEHRLNWRLYREYSRGLMAELASHQLDVINWFLGTPPARAIGSGGIDYWRDGREVFDNVYCVYEYPLRTPEGEAYTARAAYSSIQSNAFEGASELIMGDRGTLLLTQRKGLLYREAGLDDPGWDEEGRADRDAAIITSGKTLSMENDPWVHRGKPFEIDSQGDDSRDQLISFLEKVSRRDPETICDAWSGVEDTATVVMGDQAMLEGGAIELPAAIASGPAD